MRSMRYAITPEMHERIKSIYQRDSGNGQISALAKAIKLPRWKVTRYAVEHGWTPKQKKEPDWSGAEIKILHRNAHLCLNRIQLKLKRKGFQRSVFGIMLKRKRMRILSNLEGHSARSVAECLGVDVHFVTKAINAGRLRSTMRGTDRKEIQGGDIYYIKDEWVRNYVLENLHEIDIRKVDKYWFVELLSYRNGTR